jgi:hypothetical protein
MLNWRRFRSGATGRNACAGNASAGLVNTGVKPASVVQSAVAALQASSWNERSALNLFCDPGSALPSMAGRSSAETFTRVTRCGAVPAKARSADDRSGVAITGPRRRGRAGRGGPAGVGGADQGWCGLAVQVERLVADGR